MGSNDKLVDYRQWRFKVDYNRTKEVHDSLKAPDLSQCSCPACQNFAANRGKIYPAEFEALLAEFGIYYLRPYEVDRVCRVTPGKHRYDGWFLFKGQIVNPGKVVLITPDKVKYYESITLTKEFSISFNNYSGKGIFDTEDIGQLVQLNFTTILDWMIDAGQEKHLDY